MGMSDTARVTRAMRVLEQEKHPCGGCEDPLPIHGALALVQFVTVTNYAGSFKMDPVLKPDGTYRWLPFWFHRKCWEETQDMIRDEFRDVLPRPARTQCVAVCDTCEADIENGEMIGVIHWGALTLSDRSPDGLDALEMAMSQVLAPNTLCVPCMAYASRHLLSGRWPGLDMGAEERKAQYGRG